MAGKNFLNSSLAQVVVIGILAFCGPGMFNALNGLGSVGTGDPKVAAIANGTLYAFFSVFGYFAGVFFNLIGAKLCFILGSLTYGVYGLCNYYFSVHPILPAIGGTVLGIGAGIFWCAQTSLTLGYATTDEKGKFTSIFWVIFNLGGFLGGLLQFVLNWSKFDPVLDSAGNPVSGGLYNNAGNQASPGAYWTFIAIMFAGSLLGLVLLVNPKKVRRSDGQPVHIPEAMSAGKEIKAAAKAIKDPFVIRMFVYFLFSNWFYTYEFNYLNGHFFNIRGAGMNSALYWGAQMLGAVMLPAVCDSKKAIATWSVGKRARAGFFLNAFFLALSWILAMVIQHTSCGGNVDKSVAYDYRGLEFGDEFAQRISFFPNVCDSDYVKTTMNIMCSDGCEFLNMIHHTDVTPKKFGTVDVPRYLPVCRPEKAPECTDVKDVPASGVVPLCGPSADEEVDVYGTCGLDVKIGKSQICSNHLKMNADGVAVDTAGFGCLELDLNYTSENAIIIVDMVLMGISDAIFQVYAMWLIGQAAGARIEKTVQYASAYKGIQSFGAAIVWLSDYAGTNLYRYQGYVNICIGVIAIGGAFWSISTVENQANEQAQIAKEAADAVAAGNSKSDYEYDYSYASSG